MTFGPPQKNSGKHQATQEGEAVLQQGGSAVNLKWGYSQVVEGIL